jgi:hypothetical protein
MEINEEKPYKNDMNTIFEYFDTDMLLIYKKTDDDIDMRSEG